MLVDFGEILIPPPLLGDRGAVVWRASKKRRPKLEPLKLAA
jgi:hypothetical protein